MKIDAGGATLLPGLADSHCHPFEVGWLKRSVDLRGTANITAVRLRLATKVRRAQPREWVVGMGWDQEAFPAKLFPSRSDIDDMTLENPVILSRVCGHVGLVNSRAIEALGLETQRGEEYERGPDGKLTGIIKEGALVDAYARLPDKTVAACMNDLLSAEVEAVRSGLCTLHCIVSPDGYREELEALAGLKVDDKLSLRYRVYMPPEAIPYVEEKKVKRVLNDDRARINGVKLYADGSLGARTAALREPYTDDPGNTGLLRYADEELAALVEKADSMGYQVIVHAIGDRAVEQAIGALSVVAGARNLRRHRIEHGSLLPKDLRAEMVKHSIRIAVQPSFISSDKWALARLGEERVNDLYPLKSIMAEGIAASGGSDAPIENINPMIGVWAAMVRAGHAFVERLEGREGLELYTSGSAANGMDDGTDGTIEEGKLANLTLLDSDVSEMHPAMLRKVGVTATIVAGTSVYSSSGEAP
ncbi:MAG: amidohydrolase [Nitrososphaerales archaeon]|nr:amidohydrolase [Nitrososphaerales archaeon]